MGRKHLRSGPVPRAAIVAVLALIPATVVALPTGSVSAAAAAVTCDPFPTGTPPADVRLESYSGITPTRLVDTRDGTGGASAPVGAGCTLRLDLDQTIVPGTASAVSLSVTGISDRAGFLTVFPCASGLPGTSNVNPRAGFPTPNLVVGTPDANREICIYSLFETDVLVDVAGWWQPGPDRFRSIAPARAIDTRGTATGVVFLRRPSKWCRSPVTRRVSACRLARPPRSSTSRSPTRPPTASSSPFRAARQRRSPRT